MKLVQFASSLFTMTVFSTFRDAVLETFTANSDSVCLIFAVFRHGQRAPNLFLDSDPNKSIWPDGPGSLTNEGKRQAYAVGTHLRHKYGHLLSQRYEKDEIYVRSTDVDRCLMTAQCSLAGLYPPKQEDMWKAGLNWQPIPVHTLQKAYDPFNVKYIHEFVPPPDGYPTKLQQQAYRVVLDNQDTMAALTTVKNKLGMPDISFSLQVLDTYLIETATGLSPHFPPGLDMDITKASFIYNNTYYLLCHTTKHIVSASVHLLEDIVAKSINKINGETPKQKAYLYSMHDINISGAMAAFTDEFVMPDFTATLIFELHKDPKVDNYYVKILYKEGPGKDFKVVPVNGATQTPFMEFQRLSEDFANSSKRWTEKD